MLAITLAYFLFYQKRLTEFGEDRWYFPLLFASLISISKGTLMITNYIKRYSKIISIIIIVLLIGYGGYYELQHTDLIIKNKLDSYNGIKQASLAIKQISNSEDIIVSVPTPQTAYYSERKVIGPGRLTGVPNPQTKFEDFLSKVNENKNIRFVVVSFSEPNHPEWMIKETYTQNPQTGQTMFAAWEISFMDTKIDFVNNVQDIKQSIQYGNLKFKLLNIFEESFVYEIERS